MRKTCKKRRDGYIRKGLGIQFGFPKETDNVILTLETTTSVMHPSVALSRI